MTCALINQLAVGDWEYDNGLWTAVYPRSTKRRKLT